MELASAKIVSGLENCGEMEDSITERDFPATHRIDQPKRESKRPPHRIVRGPFVTLDVRVSEQRSLRRNEI